jgi:carbonic anhydrase
MVPRLGWLSLYVAITVSLIAFAQKPKAAPEFGYSGVDGPQAWGDLSAAYAACKQGHAQSPIDIREPIKEALPRIEFHCVDTPLRIVNNGHSIQVNYAPGSWITVGDKKYELRQFHFHHPSEEHINGRSFDMVAHLVHADAKGKLAVVAVLLQSGNFNEAIHRIWKNLPKTLGKELEITGVTINAGALLPQTLGYYTFEGSLTTPPCTEGVTWFVLKTPTEVSSDEVTTFAKLYPCNARPIQPTGRRKILETQF